MLLLFFLVIGGLNGTLDVWTLHLTFSPTEAAGMGAFINALARGALTVRDTFEVLRETADSSIMG